MAKTEMTQLLEKSIWRETNAMGVFGCFEVTIGWYGKERVDYMTYNTKGEFRCYEVKVSNSDFNSDCHNTFLGHYNYYVMTPELFELLREKIPKDIGVYTSLGHGATCVKKARRKELTVDENILKDSMIRSLCRDATKLYKNDEPTVVERLTRDNGRLKRERDNYYFELQDLKIKEHKKRYDINDDFDE